MNRYTLWFGAVAAAFVLFAGCQSESSGPRVGDPDKTEVGRVSLEEKLMSATLTGGNLEVKIPLTVEGSATIKGSFELTIRHLDGSWNETATGLYKAAPGTTTVVATFDRTPPMDGTGDQSTYVLDYRIDTPDGTIKGYRSLFALLPKLNVIVYAPQTIFPDQKSFARVIVNNPMTDQPIADTLVTVILKDANDDEREVEVTTDAFGTAVVELESKVEGDVEVKALVMTPDGEESAEGIMQVVRESRVLVTTDKPLYQPGQKMYIRALALEKPNLTPEAGQELLFEVQDAKGNKVFKQAVQTNDFGVAATEFTLATQVNMGAYKIVATLDDVATEKTVTVDRYSLPKFKVSATLDKTFYMPGDTIHGEVQADYFFGKTVAGGQVEVTVYKYEAEWTPDTILTGQTNDVGLYIFDYDLPDYLVGQPLDQGKALVLMEIKVSDLASQSVTQAKNILVTNSLMDIALLPESGVVVPDVPNSFFLFLSDPTGGPLAGTATLTINGAEFDDDTIDVGDDGLAMFTLTPQEDVLQVGVAVAGSGGDSASASFSYNVGAQDQGVLVRTDKAVYAVGETIEVSVHTSGGHDRVFFDVIRKNQTVLTQTIQMQNGYGQTFLDIDNSMTEDLVLEAYFLSDTGQFIRDGRIVYVEPATSLSVIMTPDKETYLPGDQAVLSYTVTDQDGAPAQAALGIQVVDEAVFALSESKPGLLKLYFQLEDELANPSYQIGPGTGSSFGQLLTQKDQIEAGSPEEDSWQAKAGASLAALGDVPTSQSMFSSWEKSQFKLDEVLEPFYTGRKDVIVADLGKLADAGVFTMENIGTYFDKHVANYFDFWGNPYRITVTGVDSWDMKIVIESDGPDEKEGTWDDWSAELFLWDVVRKHGGGGGEWGEFDNANGGPMAGGVDQDAGAEPPGEPDPTSEEGGEESGDNTVKVRSWFPETLFVEPSLITEADGTASVTVPLADSITQWRVSSMGNSADGKLGSAANGIVVFQDFFVDIDFPKYLTRGDEIAFPIAVYNYLETSQNVELEIMEEDWFELSGVNTVNLTLGPQEVTGVTFPVTVTKVGWHALTVYGHGSQMSDAVQRIVEVKPDGKEMLATIGAKFASSPEPGQTVEDHMVESVVIPNNSIENSETLVVQIHPGFSSQVVGGMDNMLQLPGG
ncbi:MAG: MG2 domain-containing protein [Pseudomonadota bacterium]